MFRTNALTKCIICDAEAYGSCTRCSRALCLDHIPVHADARCVDCELVYDRKRFVLARYGAVASVAGFFLINVIVGFTSFNTIPAGIFRTIIFGVLGGALGVVPFALIGLANRRSFLAEGTPTDLLREVAIAPATNAPRDHFRGLARTGGSSRFDPPGGRFTRIRNQIRR